MRTLSIFAMALLLAGCQSLGAGGTDEPVPDDDAPVTETPADPGATALQVEVSGGFVPVGWDFSNVPQLTIYGDGRAIVHGPQTAIYPGPALPNLQVSTADVDALMSAAQDAGLLADPPDYGQPMIADLPTTFVTLTADGQTYVHAANALDAEVASAAELGLTDAQMAARVTLAEFVAAAQGLVDPDSAPYETSALTLFAWPASESENEAEVLPWPLDLPLADASECTLVEGSDAATLLDTLESASQTTRFSDDGATYDVFFRPLLPHETGCADQV